MAHLRSPTSSNSADLAREPHPISLKVLRLSRPTLAAQHPLPAPTRPLSTNISKTASVSYPSLAKSNVPFSITPLLTLPPAFGNAYVGETFSCTLSANNELPSLVPKSEDELLNLPPAEFQSQNARKITNVRIEAEMKTPSMTIPLDVSFNDRQSASTALNEKPTVATGPTSDLMPDASLQGIISFYLREEGTHVLAVTISYNETSSTSGRLRTFRKLYQFVARPCLVVRTKISNFGLGKWALEAQLENVGDGGIVLTDVKLDSKAWCGSRSLNWGDDGAADEAKSKPDGKNGNMVMRNPSLAAGDVQQVCFLVERKDEEVEEEKVEMEMDVAGRLIVGLLSVTWRGAMGNFGSLSTGWLGVKA